MKTLLEKLNYKGQSRIAVINSEKNFNLASSKEVKGIQIDNEIDQRFPYGFMMIFVKGLKDVEKYTPLALHNLTTDGVLWFCYPKKTSSNFSADIDRDHGWKALNEMDFYGIRMVSVDDDWSALRFRNKKFIKSTSDRFPK
ncbi:MAG: hypothetical protein GYA41_00275 [Bacteroidales bacterium]|nr:hypothetical protein [Bacteroidales bacterium]